MLKFYNLTQLSFVWFLCFLGCTKVEYTIHCPDQSSYTQADLQKLRKTVAIWTEANYDDIIICEIRRGSVIVSFMIKNSLIPKLEENQHHIADSLKQDVMKVKIQDNIIYESGMGFFLSTCNFYFFSIDPIRWLKPFMFLEILPSEDKIPIPRFFCKKTEKSSSKVNIFMLSLSCPHPCAILWITQN